MARPSWSRPRVISEDGLNDWKKLGVGGFGTVYKATHDEWGPVAIKVINDARAGSMSDQDLKREAEMMQRAVSLHVTKVLGAFRGRLPDNIEHVGMVMELMERGSLTSLLSNVPPWPLVFRLAHQVALGMNHLHSLTPEALIHKDLKPDNVLLDSDLNVKISDFGLAKYADNQTVMHLKGGRTIFYAPPEYGGADGASATPAFDVYSYAMLVFVILNAGHKPESFDKNEGERPSLKVINGLQAPGVKELVKLMVRCWDQTPEQRPSFAECARETARLYEMHKSGIKDAVRRMKGKLDGVSSARNSQGAASSSEYSGYRVTFHGGNSSTPQAPRYSSRASSGRVKYGELTVLGHSDSDTKSHFTLYQRPEANGVKQSTVHKGNQGTNKCGQNSISFTVTPVSTVIVEFEDDRNTDMFQIGRATDSQIDFRVTDTVSTSVSDISRYACRIICQRRPPYKAHIYAAGFNSDKNIFLGKDAVKWESHGQMDGLTTNGVLVMQPLPGFTPGPWMEISVFGNAFTPRDSPTSRECGKRVSSEPQELVDGSLIDLCGVTLLWRTTKSPIENLNSLLRDLPR